MQTLREQQNFTSPGRVRRMKSGEPRYYPGSPEYLAGTCLPGGLLKSVPTARVASSHFLVVAAQLRSQRTPWAGNGALYLSLLWLRWQVTAT